jgi:hypothetical protein
MLDTGSRIFFLGVYAEGRSKAEIKGSDASRCSAYTGSLRFRTTKAVE